MRLLTRAGVLLFAIPGCGLAAEALIPPKPPAPPPASTAAPPAAAADRQEPPVSADLAGSSVAARQNAVTDLDAPVPRQRHHRRSGPAAHANRRPAGSAHVDRALADQLTNQLNQREVQQMRSARGRIEPGRGAEELNREQLEQPGGTPPAGAPPQGISRVPIPDPNRGPYPPR